MSPVLPMLAIGAACLVCAMGLGVTAIMREQRRRQRFHDRMDLVAGAYVKVNPLAVMGQAGVDRSVRFARLIAPAAHVFGYEPAYAEHYWPRWWIVLGGALVAARGVSALAGILAGSWSMLVWPFAWIMFARLVFRMSIQKRRDALFAQFPDALAMIVRAVRVGIPLNEGIRTVAREATVPTGPEFAMLYDRVAIGVTMEDALREMAERNQLAEYRFFATALALQSRTGGGLADALEGLADVMRRRLALKARGLALAAEAKTSIAILASLPFVAGGALAVLNPGYVGRLFTDPGCEKILMAAVVLLSSGLLVMRAMIRRALS